MPYIHTQTMYTHVHASHQTTQLTMIYCQRKEAQSSITKTNTNHKRPTLSSLSTEGCGNLWFVPATRPAHSRQQRGCGRAKGCHGTAPQDKHFKGLLRKFQVREQIKVGSFDHFLSEVHHMLLGLSPISPGERRGLVSSAGFSGLPSAQGREGVWSPPHVSLATHQPQGRGRVLPTRFMSHDQGKPAQFLTLCDYPSSCSFSLGSKGVWLQPQAD